MSGGILEGSAATTTQGKITKGDTDYVHADNTTEDLVKEFLANDNEISLVLDCTLLAQTTTIRVYEKVDGTTYRLDQLAVFPTDFDGGNVSIKLVGKGLAQKITMQSGTGEGETRNIPMNWVEILRVV